VWRIARHAEYSHQRHYAQPCSGSGTAPNRPGDGPGHTPRDRIEAQRIHIIHWIAADIAVGVDAACKADGIGLQVAAGGRVIVAEVVVVKARLRLQPLAGEAVVVRGGADKAVLLPEGQEARVPDDIAIHIRHLLRRAQMIGMDALTPTAMSTALI